jgi:hypothetical protein
VAVALSRSIAAVRCVLRLFEHGLLVEPARASAACRER